MARQPWIASSLSSNRGSRAKGNPKSVRRIHQDDCVSQLGKFFFAELGGLLSYGNDQRDLFQLAATYVDRILRGAKPSELPVQAPVKYELVVNLKTAKALGLDVPPLLQQRADEVIE